MERAKLLLDDEAGDGDETDSTGGLWGSLTGLVRGKDAQVAASAGRSGETINVFSLASGHLYERFLKIMMLSVLKNTNNPVKFWFLKNCMSPQLQAFLPHMAAEYGFTYELVQYKWPSWLNFPPTKHRQIWGYKVTHLAITLSSSFFFKIFSFSSSLYFSPLFCARVCVFFLSFSLKSSLSFSLHWKCAVPSTRSPTTHPACCLALHLCLTLFFRFYFWTRCSRSTWARSSLWMQTR